jgi:hypothetical protein
MAISGLEIFQVLIDALFDFPHPQFQFALRKILVAIIDCLEFAAIDNNQCVDKQIELLTEKHKLAADLADGFVIVFAEVGDGFKIGSQATGQLHQFDIALRFTF